MKCVAVAICLLASVTSAQTPLKAVSVVTGLRSPLDVCSPPGDEERLFIVGQYGTIWLVKNGVLQTRPFLQLSTTTQIAAGGERGLLGLAFHPRYAQNGYFYVSYTRSGDGASMVVRYRADATDPDVADPSTAATVIGPISQPYANHNGGCVRFGPDGYLYFGLGDGGSGGDPACNAQNPQSWLGKMLRLDVDVAQGYAIPATNPFRNNTAYRPEIWHVGWRNPWRFSFDRLTGDMYIGDVGQGAREEISFQSGKSPGGENYGWKIMEGVNCYGTSACTSPIPCNDPRLVKPIWDYARTAGRSVTGGNVYRGCAIPDLRGTYFFGDYETARIWSFRYDGKAVTEYKERSLELNLYPKVSGFGEDARGELYICDHTLGAVHKIVSAAPPAVTDLGYGKQGGDGRTPRFDACGMLDSGKEARFTLDRAPANTLAVLVVAAQSNPTQLLGGTIVPFPPTGTVQFMTDAEGRVAFTIPGGGGPVTLYAQYAILDPKATFGTGISNALQIDFQK